MNQDKRRSGIARFQVSMAAKFEKINNFFLICCEMLIRKTNSFFAGMWVKSRGPGDIGPIVEGSDEIFRTHRRIGTDRIFYLRNELIYLSIRILAFH